MDSKTSGMDSRSFDWEAGAPSMNPSLCGMCTPFGHTDRSPANISASADLEICIASNIPPPFSSSLSAFNAIYPKRKLKRASVADKERTIFDCPFLFFSSVGAAIPPQF